jgi:hypothetical protein
MSYIPEYHENYYRVEGTAYNQGKIGIGTINPVQLLHVSGGNIRLDGSGYINGDFSITGNLNVYTNANIGDSTVDNHTINGTLTNSIPDNTATAVDFKEAANSYLKLTTSDGSELVTIGANPKFTSLNTTDATNSTTAAATFAGGVGIAKKLYVGSDLNVSGNTNLGDNYSDIILVTGKFLRGIRTITGADISTRTNSTLISSDKNIVTGVTIVAGSLQLPTAIAGMEIEIRNRASQTIGVYANGTTTTDRIYDNNFLYLNATPIIISTGSNKNFSCAPSGGINIWFT